MTVIVRCFFAGALLFPAAPVEGAADTAETPYRAITERNVFNLKAPARPEDNPPPRTPPPRITLTGITTILGNKRALMRVTLPPRPPEPPKEESYMLTEGQRDGNVEVVAIDENAGTVRVMNHGEPQTLDFANNGAKLQATAAPVMGLPGMPPAQGGPGVSTATGSQVQPLRPIPTRQLRVPGGPGQMPGTGAPTGNQSQALPQANQYQPSPEEQIIAIEVQRLKMQSEGDPAAVLMPPTELTPQ